MPINNKEFQARERIRKANEKWLKDETYKPGGAKNRGKTWLPRKYDIDEEFIEPDSQVYFKD